MPFEIVKPGTHFDFIGKWRICVAISTALVLLGVVGIPLRGFRLGIDFAGGTEVQVRFVDAGLVDEEPSATWSTGSGSPTRASPASEVTIPMSS